MLQNYPERGLRKLRGLISDTHSSGLRAAPPEIWTVPAFRACLVHGPSLLQQPENILRQKEADV